METALAIARFLHHSAAIQLFGTAVFETWIAPRGLSDGLLATTRRIAIFNAWLLALSAILWLGAESGMMGEGWSDAVNLSTIWQVITATGFGAVWAINIVIAFLAVLASYVFGPRRRAVLAVLATSALGGLAFVGHSVAQIGPMVILSEASQVVHLLSSGFWFGSLLSVVLLLSHLRDSELADDADLALRRFSGLGHLAVALALASGVANSWFILHDRGLDPGSLYQWLLLAKVTLVGSMCIIALINRYVFMPAIPHGPEGLVRLRDGTVAELIIGTVVIALVSVLGLLSP